MERPKTKVPFGKVDQEEERKEEIEKKNNLIKVKSTTNIKARNINNSSNNSKLTPSSKSKSFTMTVNKPYFDCWEENKGGFFLLSGDTPPVVREAFLSKGWKECFDPNKDYWNIYWRPTRFNKTEAENLLEGKQLVNHIISGHLMTKKDCLVKAMIQMKKLFGESIFYFTPISFILPIEIQKFQAYYNKRVEEGVEEKDNLWIMKPSDLSRGRGIFLLSSLDEARDNIEGNSYVVQHYIPNPLLIYGYKFDLRIYILITSYHPLKAYIYKKGLVRFATEKYQIDDLTNKCCHLTNASINKYGEEFNSEKEGIGKGSKWSFQQLKDYFEKNNISWGLIWKRIENIIMLTLLSFVYDIPIESNKSTFELYGFDILLDDLLNPHLLEVNYSPCLSIDSEIDEDVKRPLLLDMIDILQYEMRNKLSEKEKFESIMKEFRMKENAEKKILKNLASNSTSMNKTTAPIYISKNGNELNMPKQIGDYLLLFPFNKTADKCSHYMTHSFKRKDTRPFREIIKQLKKRTENKP
ncbi:hypothetical protein ABK040_001373 [Willaertia magna]